MTKRILEADSFWLEYGSTKILQNVYVRVETGQIVGMLGRNGTGKSSLLRMLFGTLRGQTQSVRVDQKYLSHPYQHKKLIRYLPQHHFVPPYFRLEAACQAYEVPFVALEGYFPELGKYRTERLGDLSGGAQRLVETLLILLSPVDFVLLDEPFSQLAPVVVERLEEVIRAQAQTKGILLSDHAYRPVLNLSDAVYLLVPVGRTILLENPLEELRWRGYLP